MTENNIINPPIKNKEFIEFLTASPINSPYDRPSVFFASIIFWKARDKRKVGLLFRVFCEIFNERSDFDER
jgi:hypothetical protein